MLLHIFSIEQSSMLLLKHTGEKTQMLTDKMPKMLSHSGGIPQIWKVSKSQQTIIVTVLLLIIL